METFLFWIFWCFVSIILLLFLCVSAMGLFLGIEEKRSLSGRERKRFFATTPTDYGGFEEKIPGEPDLTKIAKT